MVTKPTKPKKPTFKGKLVYPSRKGSVVSPSYPAAGGQTFKTRGLRGSGLMPTLMPIHFWTGGVEGVMETIMLDIHMEFEDRPDLLYRLCFDTAGDSVETQTGMYTEQVKETSWSGWIHVPMHHFPSQFRAALLLLDIK